MLRMIILYYLTRWWTGGGRPTCCGSEADHNITIKSSN